VNVAKILLQQKLGYTVEIVSIDENAQFPALAKGDLSASLEVWPSGHASDIKQYIDGKLVANLGLLGPALQQAIAATSEFIRDQTGEEVDRGHGFGLSLAETGFEHGGDTAESELP